jgi:hypothetical protein
MRLSCCEHTECAKLAACKSRNATIGRVRRHLTFNDGLNAG